MLDRKATMADCHWFFFFAEAMYAKAIGREIPEDHFFVHQAFDCARQPVYGRPRLFEALFLGEPMLSELDEAMLQTFYVFEQLCASGDVKKSDNLDEQLERFRMLLAGCCSYVGKHRHDAPYDTKSWGVVFGIPAKSVTSVEIYLVRRANFPQHAALIERVANFEEDFRTRFNETLNHAHERVTNLHAPKPRAQENDKAPAATQATLTLSDPLPTICLSGKDKQPRRGQGAAAEKKRANRQQPG